MKRLMATEELTMAEYRLAILDEIDIEGLLCEYLESPEELMSDSGKAHALELQHALRTIDELKGNGTYETTRARLRQKIPPEPVYPDEVPEIEHLNNVLSGMDSPDDAQRRRFHDLWNATNLGEMSFREALPILRNQERAKKGKGGRPAIQPKWRNELWALEKMEGLIPSKSVPEAARLIAEAELQKHSTKESRAKLFERNYRKRRKLREINLDEV